MKDNVFRKYDIRGKVGSELELDKMYDLGKALAYYFLKHKPETKTVALGMDGRTHSPDIKKSLSDAMLDSGLDVVFIGVCPSPVLYFTLHKEEVDAGLMITASHNPKAYNGVKICLGKKMVWGQEIQELKKMFHEKKQISSSAKGGYREKDMIDPYIDWMKEHFPSLVGMDLSAVVDCGNGVAGTVMPSLIKKMEWKKVKTLFEKVDGDYPNHEADPVVPENMRFVKDFLQREHVDVGIGLDGDCDRMAPMTKRGELVPGDKLLAVYAKPIIKKYPGAVVVCDIKASEGLAEFVKNVGGNFFMSPSGHSIVKKYMHEHNALLGGELSCHFFFLDRHFGYDDGFYSMMRLFEIMVESGKSLQELIADFPKKCSLPEMRIQCPDDKKKYVVEGVKSLFEKRADVKIITIDGVRVVMDYGWGILRVSNTQPVISLRMEAETKEGLQKVKKDFYDAMRPYFERDFLKKEISL
ncbi:phosphomannomutase/phosphoglucomutase [Candidatus Dependentiae bacterium]